MNFPWYARSMYLKFVAVLFCLFLIFPVLTIAHGSLESASLQPDSQLAQPTSDVELPEPISMRGYDAHQHSDQDVFSMAMVVQYVVRGLWYICLLALLGWLVWLRLLPSSLDHYVPDHLKMLHNLQRAHFISLLLLVLSNVEDLLGSHDITNLKQLFLATSVGLSLSGLLVLAALGFLFLGRYIALDFIWVILILAFKGISGHAVAFSSPWLTMPLHTIHIFVASLWVGGLLLLLIRWKKEASTIYLFVERFSYVAMFSLIGLGITGTLMIFRYIPELSYLLFSMWGIFLIAKVAIVLLIAGLSWLLKRYIRSRDLPTAFRLLKLEILGMVVVLLLVGFISYLAPLPTNEKLNWHVMGDTIHMTSQIEPMQVGNNTFRLKVWLPNTLGEPSSVKMTLRYLDENEADVIEVPLKNHVIDSEMMGFAMVQHTFQAYGPYLPYRGKYQLEVKVIDHEGKETVYQKEIRLF